MEVAPLVFFFLFPPLPLSLYPLIGAEMPLPLSFLQYKYYVYSRHPSRLGLGRGYLSCGGREFNALRCWEPPAILSPPAALGFAMASHVRRNIVLVPGGAGSWRKWLPGRPCLVPGRQSIGRRHQSWCPMVRWDGVCILSAHLHREPVSWRVLRYIPCYCIYCVRASNTAASLRSSGFCCSGLRKARGQQNHEWPLGLEQATADRHGIFSWSGLGN